MNQAHLKQRAVCQEYPAHRPILNCACKEDPASLGRDFDAVNLDLYDFDEHTNCDLNKLPNFVKGDATNLPFPDSSYRLVIIGELLEHCKYPFALKVMQEARRVCADDGLIYCTFPLDARPPEHQHSRHLLVSWSGDNDITSWHQTVWEVELQEKLLTDSGLLLVKRETIHHGIPGVNLGFGILLKKDPSYAKPDVSNLNAVSG